MTTDRIDRWLAQQNLIDARELGFLRSWLTAVDVRHQRGDFDETAILRVLARAVRYLQAHRHSEKILELTSNIRALDSPAVLWVKATDNNPAEDEGDQYRRGEIIYVSEQDHDFGWREMPINQLGQFTVDQVNNVDTDTLPLYGAVKLLDSGTITSGSEIVEAFTEDVLVWHRGRWKNYGDQEVVPDLLYHVRIEDRTVVEALQYMERWNHKVTYESLQYNPETGMRRVRATSERVSSSGRGAFSQEGVDQYVEYWEGTLVSWDDDQVTMDANLPAEIYPEFKDSSDDIFAGVYVRQRRWYMTEDGMADLVANDGVISGPAAVVGQHLRDGLLD